ncbi:MAG: FtsX-like permease family protein [Steroidobacteraceae bacterium]
MADPAIGLSLRVLLLSQWRQQPARFLIMLAVIALGVALGTSVYLVNGTALGEFQQASARLMGQADLLIRAGPTGMPESVYAQLAADPRVRNADPVIEIMAALPGQRPPLKILGLDIFRAAELQPALLGELRGELRRMFSPRSLYLSATAAAALGVSPGQSLTVVVGNQRVQLEVLGILSEASYPGMLGLMDISAAQWTFKALGRINRIDLSLAPGVDRGRMIEALERGLPAGAVVVLPQVEIDRAATVTRAYRVNLNMLALVSLLTAMVLMFSIQSLAMLRRRAAIGLLRALGVTVRQLLRAMLIEGLIIGALASALGVMLGVAFAAGVVQWLHGDFGNGQLHIAASLPRLDAAGLVIAFLVGTALGCLGATLPALEAAHRDPARSLKPGDPPPALRAARGFLAGLVLLLTGAALSRLPAQAGLPVAGYLAIALLLFGAILWVPLYTAQVLRWLPATRHAPLRLALQQLRGNRATLFLSLAPLIVSFALMVAMAIMVHSFRQSFEVWLDRLLPADIQVRLPFGSDTAAWSVAQQREVAALPGIARADFRRTRPLYLRGDREPVMLIARDMRRAAAGDILPLVARAAHADLATAAWASEAAQAKYGWSLGQEVWLPVGASLRRFTLAGVWRDYARTEGAVVIDRATYGSLSGDTDSNDASIWLAPGADAATVSARLRERLGAGGALELLTSDAVKQRSLRTFDRAFAVTYGLEALAVIIGLIGISVASSFTAITRRAEFGMLRHLGLLRRQLVQMQAAEGVATALMGCVYGICLGILLSLVLVYVINRQSFNWSIDLALPAAQLGGFAALLVIAAALTAVASGRAAMGEDAIQAVREDW